MQCPKCKSEAPDFKTVEGVLLNFCNACHGLWFDRGELALYCETERDVPNIDALLPMAQDTPYACPRCPDEQLAELPYMAGEDLLIDWCASCHGAWLDAREIIKVEALSARYELHTARLLRGINQLENAGYVVMQVKTT